MICSVHRKCVTKYDAGERDSEEALKIIERELFFRWRIQRHNALQIGELYHRAKKLLPHGEFTPWVKKVGLYQKSAVRNYIRIYRLCKGRPELVESILTTKLQIICQRNFPEDTREATTPKPRTPPKPSLTPPLPLFATLRPSSLAESTVSTPPTKGNLFKRDGID